eukprot:gene9044-16168_t
MGTVTPTASGGGTSGNMPHSGDKTIQPPRAGHTSDKKEVESHVTATKTRGQLMTGPQISSDVGGRCK